MPRFHPRSLMSLLPLVLCLLLGGAIVRASASAFPAPDRDERTPFASPVLTSAPTTFRPPHTHIVTGVDFTPGGRVEVELYDASETNLLETRSATATSSVYVRDWRDDPADGSVGFTRAGVISETIALSCGSPAKVRAYDQQTARWSDWLELDPGC